MLSFDRRVAKRTLVKLGAVSGTSRFNLANVFQVQTYVISQSEICGVRQKLPRQFGIYLSNANFIQL